MERKFTRYAYFSMVLQNLIGYILLCLLSLQINLKKLKQYYLYFINFPYALLISPLQPRVLSDLVSS